MLNESRPRPPNSVGTASPGNFASAQRLHKSAIERGVPIALAHAVVQRGPRQLNDFAADRLLFFAGGKIHQESSFSRW